MTTNSRFLLFYKGKRYWLNEYSNLEYFKDHLKLDGTEVVVCVDGWTDEQIKDYRPDGFVFLE